MTGFQTSMKIAHNSNYVYSQPTRENVHFKGWAAAPIKELYLQPVRDRRFISLIEELNKKCKQYFKIMVQTKNGPTNNLNELKTSPGGSLRGDFFSCWSQDNKIFFENNKLGIFNESFDPKIAKNLAKSLLIDPQEINLKTQGGNCFLGKKPNGESYALVGVDALSSAGERYTAKMLNVSTKNLHIISQPNFHIDMVVRPLTYPYVLVGAPHLTAGHIKEPKAKQQLSLYSELYYKSDPNKDYASTAETIKELKAHGFQPICVPGLLAENKGLNFMNAIVHQKPDGKLIYITNKTDLCKKLGVDFEGIFEKDLKSKVPNVEKVIFIDGEGLLQSNLTELEGGIHCMTCERPDFAKWNKWIKSAK